MTPQAWNPAEDFIIVGTYYGAVDEDFTLVGSAISDNMLKALALLLPRHSEASIKLRLANVAHLDTAGEYGMEHVGKLTKVTHEAYWNVWRETHGGHRV